MFKKKKLFKKKIVLFCFASLSMGVQNMCAWKQQESNKVMKQMKTRLKIK